MAADVLPFQHVLVHEKLYMVLPVVHQPQDADGAGGDVQKLLHILRRGKAQAGGADLLGENTGLKMFVPGEHQQIKVRTLPVAQQQILADHRVQHPVDLLAGLHGHSRLVIDAPIVDSQAVQQIVAANFLLKPSGAVGGTSVYQFHSYHPFLSCQKATALAAATFKESTPWYMGIFTV